MKISGISTEIFKGLMRTAVAGVLCVLMVDQPMLAEGQIVRRSPTAPRKGVQGEQKVLHALNRFTFGPRPGDVEAVQAMGLQRWFDRQLNPASIDDSALEARLGMFPAMRMEQAELLRRYPNTLMLRQMVQKNAPLPSDPVEHAIYADQIAFYKEAQAKKAAKESPGQSSASGQDVDGATTMPAETADAVAPAAGKGGRNADLLGDGGMRKKAADNDSMAMEAGKVALPGDNVDPSTPAMEEHAEKFYSGLEAVKIINLPPDERMRRVLAMQPAEVAAFGKSLSRSEQAAFVEGLSPIQREALAALKGSPRMVGAELLQARMLRDIYSQRQLEAVMTDFWLNHFNVYVKKNQNEPYLLPAFERDVIRPNALGRFEDMLVATAKSPAMLMYLDNFQSIGPDSMAARNAGRFAQYARNPQVKQAAKDRGLNENYARELMELHTVGVQCEVSADHPASELDKACGRGYSQQDVTQVAKVLTGWTMDRPFQGGAYEFQERRHEPGSKQVMGVTIHENGEREGLQLLHMLATSPATAKFISTKLAVRFVSDTPPSSLVDKMAAAFEASGGDIKVVLRTMFDAPEFWSPEVYRAKVKTPLEFVVSAVRASDAEVVNALPLVQALDRLGMPLYGMQTPNGYSWMAEQWVNTGDLVSRMNFALVLSGDRLAGVRTDWPRLLGAPEVMKTVSLSSGGSDAAAAKEEKLEMLLLGVPVSDKTRATVLQQLHEAAAQQQAAKNFPIRGMDPELMAGVVPGGSMANQEERPLARARDQQAAVMAGLLLGSPEFQRR
jgi:uncharacterized protein (DUF1800 family)